MVKIVNLSYGSSCLLGKEKGYCGDFCCVASQCKAGCTALRHRWEPESSKESWISFLLVEKEEKKLLAEHCFTLKDFNLGFFKVERFSCSEKKPTCTWMVKEVPFLNGNLSIYSCFIDVLCHLRWILTLTFDVFGCFYLREMIHDPVGITRIAFKDKIMGFRIKFFNK